MCTVHSFFKNKLLLLHKSVTVSGLKQPYASDAQADRQLLVLDLAGVWMMPTWHDRFSVLQASQPQLAHSRMPLSPIQVGILGSPLLYSLTFHTPYASSLWPIHFYLLCTFKLNVICCRDYGRPPDWCTAISSLHTATKLFLKHVSIWKYVPMEPGGLTCSENFIIPTLPQNGSWEWVRIPYQWCLAYFHGKALI